MRTIRTKLYLFTELNKEAQQKAISNYSDINTDFDWWECIFLDAKTIELYIDIFDTERKEITGKFYISAYKTAKHIIENHGEDCNTYKIAQQYLVEYGEALELVRDEDFYDYFYDRNELFLKELLNCYLKMLQSELDYRESEEAIKETLIANEYEFLSTGKIYS